MISIQELIENLKDQGGETWTEAHFEAIGLAAFMQLAETPSNPLLTFRLHIHPEGNDIGQFVGGAPSDLMEKYLDYVERAKSSTAFELSISQDSEEVDRFPLPSVPLED